VNQRVLVVEDNPLNCELLRDWLEVEGYKVLIAENLSAAMAAVESEQPNAVLLDIQLGSEDGLALMPWMHQRPSVRQIPVIAVTAHAMLTERERILDSGCKTIISKPIDFKLLRSQLRLWINGEQTLQENSLRKKG